MVNFMTRKYSTHMVFLQAILMYLGTKQDLCSQYTTAQLSLAKVRLSPSTGVRTTSQRTCLIRAVLVAAKTAKQV